MIMRKWRSFRLFVIISIVGLCVWFFIFIKPSIIICKYEKNINSDLSFAVSMIENYKVKDYIPIEKIYSNYSLLKILWPFIFFGLPFWFTVGYVTRIFCKKEIVSQELSDDNKRLFIENHFHKKEIEEHKNDIIKLNEEYDTLNSSVKMIKGENNRLRIECGMQGKERLALEKELEEKDKELQKARSKIQRLEKRRDRGKTLAEE